MSCERRADVVDAVLMGEMDDSLSKHMGACGECCVAATAAEPSGVVLRAARSETAPDGLWARVEAGLTRQDRTRGLGSTGSPQASRLPMRRRWTIPASVAALLAVMVGVWAMWPQAPAGLDLAGPVPGEILPGRATGGAAVFGPVPDPEFYLSEHRNVEEEYTFSGTSLAGNLGSGGS